MRLKAQLQRWRTAEIIDAPTAQRIEAYEGSRRGLRFSTAMFGLGALAMVLGVAAVVASNWDSIPATAKLSAHAALNAGLAAGVLATIRAERPAAREIMLFLLAGATLTFIALTGQIYQTDAPLWQALALWLCLVSPFLFFLARARFTVICWILSLWTTLGAAVDAVERHLGPMNLDMAFYTLTPFLMIAVGASRALQARWRIWPAMLLGAGYVLVVIATSGAQLAWHDDFGLRVHEQRAHVFPAFYAALAASFALFLLSHKRYLAPAPPITSLFLPVSVLISFAPLLMRHPQLPVVGAGLFMAYWALIGWIGLQSGYRSLLNAAVIIIALRLVAVYVEVFGDLLSTGVGLIASGALLIAVVWGVGKIIRSIGRSA